MIQRIQTVYLLLAAIVSSICLFMQIGLYEPETMGVGYRMYNLYLIDGEHRLSFRVAPLFVLLVLQIVVCLVTIFKFNNRKQQMHMCLWANGLIVSWFVAYALYAFVLGVEGHTFYVLWPMVLPLVAFVFIVLARRGIRADEKLVRAADRIR